VTSDVDKLTAHLSEYAVSMTEMDLPEAVRAEAKRSLFNIVGCTLGGARHDGVTKTDAALSPFAGPAQASLLGRQQRRDILHASLINCLASSVYSFDDTHEHAVVHPSGPVAAAALAVAERQVVSGAALLSAFALGVEYVCRLSRAISVPPAKGDIGWSQTGITGGFGAAVAAGRLLGLDPTQMQNAIGIALAQAAGFRVMHGSMVTPMMPAQAAQTGLRAALLAEQGVTASPAALEGRYGYLSLFSDEPDTATLADGLGQRFELLRNTYKPYPCGIVIHPIIDACLALRREYDCPADAIRHVAIKASPGAMALCNRRNPIDEMQAHVSLHHWVAIAFLRGTARIQDMDTQTAVRDPAVMEFQAMVDAEEDRRLVADAAHITLSMADGSSREFKVEHCIGSASRPMTNAELEAKFLAMAEPVLGKDRAARAAAIAWDIEAQSDAGALPRAAA
jgi:2-methylcitrate dehydratase PrpD